MPLRYKKARAGKVHRLSVAALFVALALVGFSGSADSRHDVDDEAVRLADQFSKRLAESLRGNNEFQHAVNNGSSCAVELAALIVAQFALDQAQAEYDIAYQALEDCILALPDPDPLPAPDPMPEPLPAPEPSPEVLPTDGEFSVLVR